MSINKTVYTILGYDISDYRGQLITNDFQWSDTYEEITNGHIRLFDDGQNCDYLYFGYPVFSSEEYGDQSPESLEVNAMEIVRRKVDAEWCKWGEVFTNIDSGRLPFKLICFEEYR